MPEIGDEDSIAISDEDFYFLKFVSEGYISREQMVKRYADADGNIRVPVIIKGKEERNG